MRSEVISTHCEFCDAEVEFYSHYPQEDESTDVSNPSRSRRRYSNLPRHF